MPGQDNTGPVGSNPMDDECWGEFMTKLEPPKITEEDIKKLCEEVAFAKKDEKEPTKEEIDAWAKKLADEFVDCDIPSKEVSEILFNLEERVNALEAIVSELNQRTIG